MNIVILNLYYLSTRFLNIIFLMVYLSIFFVSFLAATILPFSSEIGLASLFKVGVHNNILLLIFASFGNILGSCINWLLGIYSRKFEKKKWFPFDKKKIIRASNWFEKYGKWSLLFSWVPIIGDPITFVAGTMKTNFKIFLLLVSIGKILRYFFVFIIFI